MSRLLSARLVALLEKLGGFYALTLAASAALLWAFTEVAEEAIETETLAINSRILLAIHAHASPGADAIALALSAIGSVEGILISGALFGAWLLRKGRTLDFATLVAALLGTSVLTAVLKNAYHQARPDLFPRLAQELSFSFPSGHASMSMCLYGFIAGWLIAGGPRRPWRWAIAALCVGFAGLIGFSRMYLGVHWPTDVLAGFILAIFWLVICAIGRRWVGGRLQNGR